MKLLGNLYLNSNFYYYLGVIVFVFIMGFFFPTIGIVAKIVFYTFIGLLFIDLFTLTGRGKIISGKRLLPDMFSNGDENPVTIRLTSTFPGSNSVIIFDEIPPQFQIRDMVFHTKIRPESARHINYTLTPFTRGEYSFGDFNAFVEGRFGLLQRRFKIPAKATVPVYPSFLRMRQYELLAISFRLKELGLKKIRKIGHTFEFEQIRQYVQGDDYRTINWRATARRDELMVNQFQDEKSQNVYSVIDMGRTMKMPFGGMTLLDYAINASLVISNIALQKKDKPGLITFHKEIDSIVAANNRGSQLKSLLEILYRQKTQFPEHNYELLYSLIRQKFNQRSLVLLFTNFDTISGMKRYLHYLRAIARYHLLVAIFFENTELEQLMYKDSERIRDIYTGIIAEKLDYEKREIVAELGKYGIQSILTKPKELTVKTINKYLELKARRMI